MGPVKSASGSTCEVTLGREYEKVTVLSTILSSSIRGQRAARRKVLKEDFINSW